jgi:RHS repeat-associated protein
VPSTLSHTMSIVHRESTIAVNTFYTGAMVPLEGVKAYLFTETGSYLNVNATTDAQGQVRFQVPEQNYKVRVDYLGGQCWSEVFRWQDKEVIIDEGMVDLHVTWNGQEVNGAPVYLFTDTGAYLSKNVTTDAQGHARFTVPVKPYKFRIDYNGRQYWTSVITPIAHQQLEIAVPLEQLALTPTNDPLCKRVDDSLDKDSLRARLPDPLALSDSSFVVQHSSLSLRDQGIRVASIGSLVGLITHSAVAQVAQTKVYYYLTDHLGTPQKVMDNAGVVVWSGDYRPFGEVTSGVSTIQNQFQFPGQIYEKETGLHYNYHRYYQPKTGRYVSPDPMGLKGGDNLYSYVSNNPTTRIDPLGLWGYLGHRILTQDAMRVGTLFNQIDAEKVMRANAGVDKFSNQFNDAAHYMPGTQAQAERMIQEALERAINHELAGDHDQAMFELGAGLHTLQDKFAHFEQEAGWALHLPLLGTNPDDFHKQSARFTYAYLASVKYIDSFLAQVKERGGASENKSATPEVCGGDHSRDNSGANLRNDSGVFLWSAFGWR